MALKREQGENSKANDSTPQTAWPLSRQKYVTDQRLQPCSNECVSSMASELMPATAMDKIVLYQERQMIHKN